MPIDLYLNPGSAPCRAVLLTVRALNLDVNQKLTDLMKGEHLTPEYLKINPQHTIPTLVDDDFSVWESRAIITYLVNKYGKDTGLYPEEPRARATVDQRLYFDMGTLYQRFGEYYYPQILAGAPPDAEKLKKLEQALEFMNTFLDGQEYLAGPQLTVADLSTVATISTLELTDVDFRKYPNINRWYEKMRAEVAGYKEVNETGLDHMRAIMEKFKKST
ncbi:glutathione S-transferase 1-1-like [Galleria mellonella]|uniref:Glutathione S-transferase 1-1-like n=1 Tax=Galleria mellonella TaxID=7137 RepID=A0A6J1X241_GALME|nr:glutathione S-transferase 1-1-like [Galleria mellonella]